jgi:hypothetical protein
MVDDPRYPTVPEAHLRGFVRTNLDSPSPTAAQLSRRERSLEVLRQFGVPYLAGLPVTEEETELKPRLASEIADRCVGVVICAVKGEGGDPPLITKLVEDFEAASLFSPKEQAFIRTLEPERQQLIDFCWQYEAVHVLLWALGYVAAIHPPSEICDVPKEVGIVRDHGRRGLALSAKPRTMAELLEQADVYYHLHWSAIELRLRREASPYLDEGIIRERHRALNWLIRFMDDEWDDVGTDT